ncbi:unnamed protein product [Adineta ricciae]|uniref:Uncharacterized protein n=2 Tax=Adineta ricciae TaxID=249248 RepID=A0A816BFD6_ADIRI|nr:unnamed protein product [Adineta ricciae]
MAKIVKTMIWLIVVLAALTAINADRRPYRREQMDLRSLLRVDDLSDEEFEEKRTVPQSVMIDYKVTKNTIGADRFDCTHIKHSVQQAGVCILPLPEAVAYCNVDATCGGFGLTTNENYHHAFDLADRMPAAELFKGTKTVTNVGWVLYVKQ